MTTSPRTERRSGLPLPLAHQTVLAFRFTASPRGARPASCQMDAWGWRYGTPAHDSVELVVAELTATPGPTAGSPAGTPSCGSAGRTAGTSASR